MSDFVDKHNTEYIEELLKKKAQLEEQNTGLASKIKDGDEIKTKLKQAQIDSKKLLRHREKLKNEASKQVQGTSNQELKSAEKKEENYQLGQEENEQPLIIFDDPKSDVSPNRPTTEDEITVKTGHSPNVPKTRYQRTEKTENLPNGFMVEDDINPDDPVQLRRELNALKVQHSSLIKGKRKVEEQNSSLVQELIDMGNKCEKLQTICDKLKEENQRLSTCLGDKSSNRSNDNKGDVQALKKQLHDSQEDLNNILEQVTATQQSNERLQTELNEARAVIRDLRKIPAFEVYSTPATAAVYQPLVFSAFDQDRYGYGPTGYRMVQSASGGYMAYDPKNRPKVRTSPAKRDLFKPDLTAVIDQGNGGGIEVEDHSLMSSRSF